MEKQLFQKILRELKLITNALAKDIAMQIQEGVNVCSATSPVAEMFLSLERGMLECICVSENRTYFFLSQKILTSVICRAEVIVHTTISTILWMRQCPQQLRQLK